MDAGNPSEALIGCTGNGGGGVGAGAMGALGEGNTGIGGCPNAAPPGVGAQTPPYGGVRSAPIRLGWKKSIMSATGAVLQPPRSNDASNDSRLTFAILPDRYLFQSIWMCAVIAN
jgi:hypothetical protein